MIVAAAYRLANGLVLSMPAPAFHSDIKTAVRAMYGHLKGLGTEKGYLTDKAEFLPLYEALRHAEACGQVQAHSDDYKVIRWGPES